MSVRRRGFKEYTRLEDALEIIRSEVNEIGSEKISYQESNGRVLAENVKSKVSVPPFDRAAMDGFALKAEDVFGVDENNPKELKIIGSIETGVSKDIEVGKGEAVEISTGAPMPSGANAVVKVEDTIREDSRVNILSPVSPGENVSSKGEDVEEGQVVMEAGHKIGPAGVGMLANTKNLEVKVKKKPKVGIAATGDELKKPEEELKPGEVVEVNSYTLTAAVHETRGEPIRLEMVPDKKESLRKTLEKAPDFDMLIFSGGTSVGKKDLVPEIISNLGELLFHGIAIRPGGPSAFGMYENVPVFSLAGFPAAALIAFEMIVKPALDIIQGKEDYSERPSVEAILDRGINSKLGRIDIVRTKLIKKEESYTAHPVRVTGSSILRTITEADGFVLVPEESEGFSKGEQVKVELFNRSIQISKQEV
ncbi:hypothetical protein AKJ41_03705 [candidate division MSBL1 archaeon SCGC-AAA259O05]|uniref:molybdopterin molybdotransferase n=2 Tax=candidate division MSBL1 TaxID=215777 RepID=A0A133V2R7_9EURY|nr:hypothetical protein AKJ64_03340 [candidate division MSBL1 archaeon SCGC-AAA259E17]KXB00742.1 hypothetical protein AKJ41_03705 [candidate division MSBL1 archaeon SCGC-AAA259O05]